MIQRNTYWKPVKRTYATQAYFNDPSVGYIPKSTKTKLTNRYRPIRRPMGTLLYVNATRFSRHKSSYRPFYRFSI